MTPELTKEIIVGVVAAGCTALFTGVPAALLFWWTWQRDQERLIVALTFKEWNHAGKLVPSMDSFGPACGILVRNRSLFPVHLNSAGFQIDGDVIRLETLLLPLKTRMVYDRFGNGRAQVDESIDPSEIPVQKFLEVTPRGTADRTRIVGALQTAAKRHGVSVEEILASSKVVAIVTLESGKQFTSEPFPQRLWGRAIEIMRQMDGRT
jgi:hypothetical protein